MIFFTRSAVQRVVGTIEELGPNWHTYAEDIPDYDLVIQPLTHS